MIGMVDGQGRALLAVAVGNNIHGPYTPVSAWVDTAFDGHLVFPHELIEKLKLESLVETEAILADGTKVTLETFVCYVDWFGTRVPLQVIANNGRFPLLGTGLLQQRVLHIDYVSKAMSVD
jgi:clan AA aspartic protease